MTTSAELSQYTVKELSSLAKRMNISGWHEMRKDELVRVIVLQKRRELARKQKQASRLGNTDKRTARPQTVAKKTATKTTRPSSIKQAEKPKLAAKQTLSKVNAPASRVPVSRKPASNGSSKPAATVLPASKKLTQGIIEGREISRNKKKSGSIPAPAAIPARPSADSQGPVGKRRSPAVERNIAELKDKMSKARLLSGIYDDSNGENRDRFVLIVRDSFWLHVYWELRSRLIERAKAAMGHTWHTAVPALRLFRIIADGVNNPRREQVRDIQIHSGVNNWYVDVQDPPGTFQVEIGFLSREGNFFPIASSNIVQTPESQVVEGTTKLDGHWGSVSEDFDRIYKMSGGMKENNEQLKRVFEEQLRRSMSLPLISRFGTRNVGFERTKRHFDFKVEADVVLYGNTDPSVQISIKGEPVRIAPDGTFSVRYPIAEKRQVFPIDAKSSDGIETQQVIIAIERNTKVLETVFLDNEEED